MKDKIKEIENEIEQFVVSTSKDLEDFRIKYLGSKGKVKILFSWLKEVAKEEKREAGQQLNAFRNRVQNKFDELKTEIDSKQENENKIDTSLPADSNEIGARHPLSLVRSEIIEIFNRIGFTISEGPEI